MLQEQFSDWAMSHPQVLVLFAKLSKIIRSLLEKKKSHVASASAPAASAG